MSNSNADFQAEVKEQDKWRDYICEELRKGGVRMDEIQTNLAANTKLTSEMLEIFAACKGGLKVLGWLGKLIVWVGGIAGGIAGIILLLQRK